MKTYRCPTCGKTLTRSEYEKALRIHGERERHLAEGEAELKRKQLDWKRQQRVRERQLKKDLERKLHQEKDRVRQQERARADRQQTGLREQLQRLKDRLRQREQGTTPQTEGLEFEEKLAARLRKEFPEDEILQKGKGGDVLHTVKFSKKAVGVIIYECKRTPSIQGQHMLRRIRQSTFERLILPSWLQRARSGASAGLPK